MTQEEERELHNAIENLKKLSDRVRTRREEIKVITIPETQNKIKYAIEVDRLENPQIYYHAQNGSRFAEIKRDKKGYKVVTNYKVNCLNATENEKWDGVKKYEYKNEDFEETRKNFEEAVRKMLAITMDLRENLLIW